MNKFEVKQGEVRQVNISAGGVPKRPTGMGVVSRLGLEGDKHLYRFHGGPQKALLLMAAEFYDVLAQEGFPVFYGALGENLTTVGLDPAQWMPGQLYRAGTALIELTQMRAPCTKLNPYGKGIAKRIHGESGFYAAVLETGVVKPGDIIQLVDRVVASCPFLNP